MCINRVLLEHRDAHQSENAWGYCYMAVQTESVSLERDQIPTGLTTVIIWPFIEKVCPSLTQSTGHHMLANKISFPNLP